MKEVEGGILLHLSTQVSEFYKLGLQMMYGPRRGHKPLISSLVPEPGEGHPIYLFFLYLLIY